MPLACHGSWDSSAPPPAGRIVALHNERLFAVMALIPLGSSPVPPQRHPPAQERVKTHHSRDSPTGCHSLVLRSARVTAAARPVAAHASRSHVRSSQRRPARHRVHGWQRLAGFWMPPVVQVDLLAPPLADSFRGALPPVDLRAVCLVRPANISQPSRELLDGHLDGTRIHLASLPNLVLAVVRVGLIGADLGWPVTVLANFFSG